MRELWPRHSEEIEADPTQLETFKKAYEVALRTKTAEVFGVSEDQLAPEQIETFENSIIPLSRASHLVGVRQGHTYWPKVIEESGVQPTMVVTFRAGYDENGDARIQTYTYIDTADVPKLALAAQKFNAPEGAVTLQKIAEVLHLAPAFIQDVVEEQGIKVNTFRNPTKDNVRDLFFAIKARRQ
jgi:predicted HTH domain antitoxin